jgi:hypothetical protein
MKRRRKSAQHEKAQQSRGHAALPTSTDHLRRDAKQVVYSTELVSNLEGREYRNPRHFMAPVEGATKVYIAGDWPKIRRAYEKAGVPVALISEMRALPGKAKTNDKLNSQPAQEATMAASTTTGWKLHVGPVLPSGTDTDVEYAALAYVEIGEVNNLSEIGDESASVTASAIGDERTRTLKGARTAAVQNLVVNREPLDAGQIALVAAEKAKYTYAFKLVAADAPDEDHTDSVFYYGALVMSARTQLNGNDAVTMRAFNLAIQTEILEVEAAPVTP